MIEGLAVVGGYVLGSLPFGYWLVLLFRGEDIRTQGSGNTGATNVFRLYGRRLGATVALLDVTKGFAAALLARARLLGSGRGGDRAPPPPQPRAALEGNRAPFPARSHAPRLALDAVLHVLLATYRGEPPIDATLPLGQRKKAPLCDRGRHD